MGFIGQSVEARAEKNRLQGSSPIVGKSWKASWQQEVPLYLQNTARGTLNEGKCSQEKIK